jgi:hypothetical protein
MCKKDCWTCVFSGQLLAKYMYVQAILDNFFPELIEEGEEEE